MNNHAEEAKNVLIEVAERVYTTGPKTLAAHLRGAAELIEELNKTIATLQNENVRHHNAMAISSPSEEQEIQRKRWEYHTEKLQTRVNQLEQRVIALTAESERYRAGMENWKETAERKDKNIADLKKDAERYRILMNKWKENAETQRKSNPIANAPKNQRVIIFSKNETAMAWLDRIDKRWYYAPQGGLVQWEPTDWVPLLFDSEDSATYKEPEK